MASLIDVMRSAEFKRESTAQMITIEEAKNSQELAPFLKAATLGLLPTVKSLLAEGVDPSLRYKYGDHDKDISALDAAALMGNLEVVRALLEHGVDVNDVGPSGYTVLHTAVVHSRADLDLIDLLLSAGANINAATANGSTPLHAAASARGSGDAAAILLRRGAAKDALDNGGSSPLHFAALRGHLSATRALLAAGADTTLLAGEDNDSMPVLFAACHGSVEVVKELARHGLDMNVVDAGGLTALHYQAWENNPAVVDALVEAGASVTPPRRDHGYTPLRCTVESLALEAMRVLLRHGAAPVDEAAGESGTPLLHIAARKASTAGASEAVDLLLRWGADETILDDDGKTAAEVVGADQAPEVTVEAVQSGTYTADSFMNGNNRVRELLKNAHADRVWRRRGLLLLCLARERLRRWETRSLGKGKGKGKGLLTKAGMGDSGSAGGSAVPSRAYVRVSWATLYKPDRTPFTGGYRRARYDSGCGSSSNVCGGGGGDGGDGVDN
ncbi:unnamed protein product, partial [Laminaria digitata]